MSEQTNDDVPGAAVEGYRPEVDPDSDPQQLQPREPVEGRDMAGLTVEDPDEDPDADPDSLAPRG